MLLETQSHWLLSKYVEMPSLLEEHGKIFEILGLMENALEFNG